MKNDLQCRILLESAKLMLQHGIKVMTMDELAKRIGVSKRTIYELFQDKDTLLTAILQYFKKKSDVMRKKILKKSPTVIHAIFYFNNDMETNNFSQIISRHDEIKRYHPAVYEAEILSGRANEIESVKKIFQQGIKQGVFRKDLDIDITASLLHTSFQLLWEDKKGLRQQFSFERMYDVYLHVFMRGCCTDKGLEVIRELTMKS